MNRLDEAVADLNVRALVAGAQLGVIVRDAFEREGLTLRARGQGLDYQRSHRLIVWPNGSRAVVFLASEPEQLRGTGCPEPCESAARPLVAPVIFDYAAPGAAQ